MCGTVSSSLHGVVLIVAAADHRNQVFQELEERDVDVSAHARQRRYKMEGDDLLSSFIPYGLPPRDLSTTPVGKVCKGTKGRAQQGASSDGRRNGFCSLGASSNRSCPPIGNPLE